jgi:membrane-bound ClpP family serine protease
MVSFDYKTPNLLEIILLVGFFINMVFGYLLLFKSIELPVALQSSAAMVIAALFTWLGVLWLSVIAILIEYTRKDIIELKEKLEKNK